MTQGVVLAPLGRIRNCPINPKEDLGGAYAKSLDESINGAGFSGSMTLTPPVDEEHAPELFAEYGPTEDGLTAWMVADGNKRIERIGALGYRWVIIFPQPEDDEAGSTMAALKAIAEGGADLIDEIRAKVKPGEKIAFGRINPRLTTPSALKRFLISFDRGRARFSEEIAQTLVQELIDAGEDAGEVFALAAIKQSAMKAMLDEQKRRDEEEEWEQQQALEGGEVGDGDDGEDGGELLEQGARDGTIPSGDGAGGPAPKRAPAPPKKSLADVVAERKAAKAAAQRFSIGPFFLTKEARDDFMESLENVRSYIKAADQVQPGVEGRLCAMLKGAGQLAMGGDEDLLMAAAGVLHKVFEKELAAIRETEAANAGGDGASEDAA